MLSFKGNSIIPSGALLKFYPPVKSDSEWDEKMIIFMDIAAGGLHKKCIREIP